jgi:diguanylate cyclase (GGDEF)-like protein
VLAQRQILRRRAAADSAQAASERRGQELAALVEMGELLQSGSEAQDIRAVVAHAARRLLPGLAGWLYAFNNSRDRLDLAASWAAARGGGARSLAEPADPEDGPPDHVGPSECWALKRGRPHLSNPTDEAGLGCAICSGTGGGMCVPMSARGEVQGVLHLATDPGAAPTREQVALAAALGDGVSLALANLALRERLRGQALRDALTGLYNRRFFEEMVEQLESQLQRGSRTVAALMLDLDHFKAINDRHGHAVGDAVLRAVGALLLSRLRRSDTACRYGGEEIVILMPDCEIEEATERADEIRRAVANLSTTAGSLPMVTASVGVATAPTSAPRLADAVRAADAALYEAKHTGRNRVCAAPARHPAFPAPTPPRLAVVQPQPVAAEPGGHAAG